MPFRKEEAYRSHERRDAPIHRALCHTARIRILRQLLEDDATAVELAAFHPLARNTVAGHLARLVRAGLVTYHLSAEHIAVYSATYDEWPRWLQDYVDLGPGVRLRVA